MTNVTGRAPVTIDWKAGSFARSARSAVPVGRIVLRRLMLSIVPVHQK